MTAEERILAYIDGSLSENESAELLHELSVSPEKRVVLEQHLKLAELNRLAQKPFEVPAELEEQMRRRLPIIIPNSNAAPVAMRRGAIASLLLLLRSYPTRFAVGTLIILLSGAGAYMFSNSDHSSSSTTISQNVQNAAPSPRGTTAPVESKNAPATSSTAEPAAAPTVKNSARPSTLTSQNTPSSTGVSSTSGSSKSLTNHSSTSAHRSLKNSKIATTTVVDRSNETSIGQTTIDHSNSNSAVTQTTTDVSQTSSIGMIETAPVQSQSVAAIAQGEIRERYRLNPFEMTHNPQRSPWTVRFSMGIGETFLNVPTGDNSYTTRTETSPFIGVNYSISPSFAIGAVIGNSTILTVSPQTETTTVNSVQNVQVHTYSTNSHEWFARLASRYSMNLGGSWSVEGSAEAGMLLASKSPMVCLQALGNQSLSDAIDFQFGLLASGVWTTPTAIQTSSVDQNTTTSEIITYRTHSHTTQTKIFSPALTGRVGLQYRF